MKLLKYRVHVFEVCNGDTDLEGKRHSTTVPKVDLRGVRIVRVSFDWKAGGVEDEERRSKW